MKGRVQTWSLLNAFGLVEAAASQVVGDDDVRDGVEHELDVLRVGGAGHVAVDLLCGALILGLELSLDIGSGLTIFLCPCILVETNCES